MISLTPALYHQFTHSTACGVGFNLRLDPLQPGADLDLYVDYGPGGTNPSDYDEARDSTEPSGIVSWKTALPGTYTVMVAQKSTNTPYKLTHEVTGDTGDCGSGSSGGRDLDQEHRTIVNAQEITI